MEELERALTFEEIQSVLNNSTPFVFEFIEEQAGAYKFVEATLDKPLFIDTNASVYELIRIIVSIVENNAKENGRIEKADEVSNCIRSLKEALYLKPRLK